MFQITSAPSTNPSNEESYCPIPMDKFDFKSIATQFIDHLNSTHLPTRAPHITQQHFLNETADNLKKLRNDLALVLHKIQMFSEYEKRKNGDSNSPTPHLVSPLMWNQHFQVPNQQEIFHQAYHLHMNSQQQKLYSQTVPSSISNQNLFHSHQMPTQEYIANAVANTQEHLIQSPTSSYGAFDHLRPQTNRSLISCSHVPSTPTQAAGLATKSASGKSNKARKQKYYDYCTACNKGFKKPAFIKRHYNTTIHKNAVKFNGQTDPATVPKSPHHHLPCDSNTTTDRSSNTPSEDSRHEANTLPIQSQHHSAFPGLLPQSPSSLHMQWLANRAVGTNPGINMSALMMPMKNYQLQMYPNDPAPVATQYMAINSHNTSSELQFTNGNPAEARPLPSLEEINGHRYSSLVNNSDTNVKDGSPITVSYSDITENPIENKRARIYRNTDYEKNYKTTILEQSTPNENNSTEVEQEFAMNLRLEQNSDKVIHNKNEPTEKNTDQSKNDKVEIKCYECNKTFRGAGYLTQHNNFFHSGDKPYRCTRCGKKFACEKRYTEHFEKHVGFKPHKCEICPKQFHHKTDLNRHMWLHTGNKPYKCEPCGKGYVRQDQMLRHCETEDHKRRHFLH